MENRLKLHIVLGVIIVFVFLIFASSSAEAATLCSFGGPEVSSDLLRLTNFSVSGASGLKVGDTITLKFTLENYGQYDLKLGQKGIFAAARDADNSDVSFGFSYFNTTLEYAGSRTIEVSKVLDKAGTWKVWSSYHLSLASGEKLGPDEWHVCTLEVLPTIKDSDQDGIADEKDNCPQNYNPKQEDMDGDGIGNVCDSCDDRDSDQDKIKNCLDKCPDKPENYNQYQDDDGCPDEKLKEKISLPKEKISSLSKPKTPPIIEEKIDKTPKKEVSETKMTTKPPEAVGIGFLYRVSGEIENFDYDYSRLKIGVCQAEKKCLLPFFGKTSLFCQEVCSSDGFIKYADISREGARLNYSVELTSGNYILKPIFQPVGNCRWQIWDPKEQFMVVKDSGAEGINFRYIPLGAQSVKVDVLILGIQRRAGSPSSIYTNEERKRLEDKIQEYQSALADEGLCSYSGYLNTEETRDITGVAEFPLWYTSFNIQGAIRQMLGRLNSSYLLLVGGNDLFGGISTDDFYGDLDGDNLLDIPVGRIPDPDEGDVEELINYFETAAQLHKNGGLDLSNYQAIMMGGDWTTSKCLNKNLFGRECNDDPKCVNHSLDCSLSKANGKGFLLLLLHGSDYPQKFSTNYSSEGGVTNCVGWGAGQGFLPVTIPLLNIRNSLWLALPCYGGLIEDRATSQESVPMMFLKNGGAVYIGDNDLSYGSKGCPREAMNCRDCLDSSCNTCSEELPAGDSCSGALYLEIAKRFSPGTRIGDAFLQGKNYYYANYDCPWEGRDYIYQIAHLYGDPTLKIKRKW